MMAMAQIVGKRLTYKQTGKERAFARKLSKKEAERQGRGRRKISALDLGGLG